MTDVVPAVEMSVEEQKAQAEDAQAKKLCEDLVMAYDPEKFTFKESVSHRVMEKAVRLWAKRLKKPNLRQNGGKSKANPAKAAKLLHPQSANMRGYLRVVLNLQNGNKKILWTGKKVSLNELMTMVPVPKLEQVIKKFAHFWEFSTPDEATVELYRKVKTAQARLDKWEDETTKTQVRYEYLMVMVDGFVSVTELLEKSQQKFRSPQAVIAISEYLRGSGIILMEDLIKTAAYTKDPIFYRKTFVEGEETTEELDSSIDGLNKAFGVRVGMPEVDVVESWQIAPKGVESQEMEGGSGSIEQDLFMTEPPVVGSPPPPRTPGSPEQKNDNLQSDVVPLRSGCAPRGATKPSAKSVQHGGRGWN